MQDIVQCVKHWVSALSYNTGWRGMPKAEECWLLSNTRQGWTRVEKQLTAYSLTTCLFLPLLEGQLSTAKSQPLGQRI